MNTMSNQPLISIIIPCFNRGNFLDDALQSIMNQTYENWECFIVNDGSVDATEEVALRWLQKDKRFKYERQENKGVSSARNCALVKASGQWIQFLDPDDIILKDKLAKSAIYFTTHDIIITDYKLFNEKGDFDGSYKFLNKSLTYENLILDWDIKFAIPIHCAIFKNTKILFNENFKAKEDWVFWVDFFKNSPKYQFISEKLAWYRRHTTNMTSDTPHMYANELKVYQYLYQELEGNLKDVFFTTRIQFKNDMIQSLKSKNSQLNAKVERIKNLVPIKIYTKLKKIIS